MNLAVYFILTAYFLDLVFGDPQWSAHPTRLIGRLIEKLEKRLNVNPAPRHKGRDHKWLGFTRYGVNNINKEFFGTILVITVVGLTILCVWRVLVFAKLIHPILYYTVSVLFLYFALSVKSLGIEADKVYNALRNNDIAKARKNLAMLVARDTENLDEPQIIKATVETVAESTMDGIVAPLFYIFLGGPILTWGYKAINTLDSMVGYRSERFIKFGRVAAYIDGLVNLIPAKITCLIIFICSWCCRKHWFNSGKWTLRYFLKGQAYNSEATEAVMAAALGVQLGGLNSYNSMSIQKTLIGDNLYPLNIRHIKESIKIAYMSSALFMAIGVSLILLITRR